MICDAHVHFFSPGFFDALGAQKQWPPEGRLDAVIDALGWRAPESVAALAAQWVTEFDEHHVGRAAIIASVPGDEASVAAAVAAHPERFVGFFMLDPTREDAPDRVAWAAAHGLRGICLFPAMHGYPLHGPEVARIFDLAASSPGMAIFAHCGVLSVGARTKLGLSSPFNMRYGNPLDLHRRGAGAPGCARHHSALRRGHAEGSADARGRLSQRASRHVVVEQLDALHARPDAGQRVWCRPCRRGLEATAVRHRLVLLPARVAAGAAGCTVSGTQRGGCLERRHRAHHGRQLQPAVSDASTRTVRSTFSDTPQRIDRGQHPASTPRRRQSGYCLFRRTRHQRRAPLDARQGRDSLCLHGQPRSARRNGLRRHPEEGHGLRRGAGAAHRVPPAARGRGHRRHPVRRVPHLDWWRHLFQHHAARPSGDGHDAGRGHARRRRQRVGRRQHVQGQRHRAVLPLRLARQSASARLQAVARSAIHRRARRPQGDVGVHDRPRVRVQDERRKGVLDGLEHPRRHARSQGPGVPEQGHHDRAAHHGRGLLARRRVREGRNRERAVRGRTARGPQRAHLRRCARALHRSQRDRWAARPGHVRPDREPHHRSQEPRHLRGAGHGVAAPGL